MFSIFFVGDSAVHFSTYRKPANAYAYVPWNSSHSRACLKGIIHTEVNRISSTCCDRNDFDWQVTFFRSKLFKRGYPTFEIDRIISAFNNTTSCQPRVARRNIVPFKLNHCMGADKLCIAEILKRHEGKLSEVNISPIQCFTSDRSLFRSRFNRFRWSADFFKFRGSGRRAIGKNTIVFFQSTSLYSVPVFS